MKIILSLLLVTTALRAEPFVPANDSVVLERLPRGFKPARRTKDATSACAEAREYIQLARQTAEPRFLGYAQGVLADWIKLDEPPGEVLFLRAVIRQSNHDFEGSVRDLDSILEKAPRNQAALMAKVAVLQAQGKILEAKTICQKAPWVGLEMIAAVASLNGQLASSMRALETSLDRDPQNPWGWTTLAEMAVRAGDSNLATKAFGKAPDDPYTLGAYADFLIDEKRLDEAVALLGSKREVDGLLLRLAIARKKAGLDFAKEKSELEDRFAATRAAVGSLHAREEAMFALHILGDSPRALRLAEENWKKQREPADARILIECARAMKNRSASEPALAWMRETKIEDVRLAQLSIP